MNNEQVLQLLNLSSNCDMCDLVMTESDNVTLFLLKRQLLKLLSVMMIMGIFHTFMLAIYLASGPVLAHC